MKSFLIGSLPHHDLNEALDFSFSLDIPTLVTLPKIDPDEFMVDQAFREIDGYVYQGHNLRPSSKVYNASLRFLAEEEFFKRLELVRKEQAGELPFAYKWQVSGPLTLASSLDHHPDTEDILEKYFLKVLATQTKFNSKSSHAPCLFLDEPVLAFCENKIAALEKFLSRLKSSDAFFKSSFGLHCCSKLSFELLKGLFARSKSNSGFDLISLDPSLYREEEFDQIQSLLGEKLVFAPCDSKGNKFSYSSKDEKYKSASCGQALCSLEEAQSALGFLKKSF